MTYRPAHPGLRDAIRIGAAAGKSAAQIASETDRSIGRIGVLARSLGIKFVHGAPGFAPRHLDRDLPIVRRFEAGESFTEIAADIGMSRSAVSGIVWRAQRRARNARHEAWRAMSARLSRQAVAA